MEQTVNRYEIEIVAIARSVTKCRICGRTMRIVSTERVGDKKVHRLLRCAAYPNCPEKYTHVQYDEPMEL